MTNADDEEGFLKRWSRQKRAQAAQPAAKPTAPVVVTDDALVGEKFDIAQLPDVDNLTAESDISAFLQKGVPEALKQLALRRMWSLDPAIRDFVEVAENQWDFNAAGGIYGIYQELAEGTDVGVWLAQATQTVLPQHALTQVAEPPASITPVAAAQNGACVPAPAASAVGTPDDIGKTTLSAAPEPAKQVTETSSKDMASSTTVSTTASVPRRRHGGALPA